MSNTKKKSIKKPVAVRKKAAITRKHMRRHVKMAVVPHKKNNYRPHLVRWYGLALLILVVLALIFGSNWLHSGSVLGVQQPISTTHLLDDTNAQRAGNGYKPLVSNTALSKAAAMKAHDMFNHQYWAHVSPSGVTPWVWFSKAGYDYDYAGENLAKNFSSANSTLAAWMASPKHRANILNKHYTDVGFAVVDGVLDGEPTTLIVAMYGSRPAPVVAGVSLTPTPITEAPIVGANMSFMSQFGLALQSMTPAVLGSVILVLFAAVVSLVTYINRKKLPQPVRQSWRYHQALYKASGLTVLAIMIVALYTGGQI